MIIISKIKFFTYYYKKRIYTVGCKNESREAEKNISRAQENVGVCINFLRFAPSEIHFAPSCVFTHTLQYDFN